MSIGEKLAALRRDDRQPIDVIRSGQIGPLLDAIANERAGTFA